MKRFVCQLLKSEILGPYCRSLDQSKKIPVRCGPSKRRICSVINSASKNKICKDLEEMHEM